MHDFNALNLSTTALTCVFTGRFIGCSILRTLPNILFFLERVAICSRKQCTRLDLTGWTAVFFLRHLAQSLVLWDTPQFWWVGVPFPFDAGEPLVRRWEFRRL